MIIETHRIENTIKLCFSLCLAITNSAFASPNDEIIGQKISASVALCHSADYLQQKYCKKLDRVDIKSCSAEAITILPNKVQSLFYSQLPELLPGYKSSAIELVDAGYSKTLANAKGNKNDACIAFWNLILDVRKKRMAESRALLN